MASSAFTSKVFRGPSWPRGRTRIEIRPFHFRAHPPCSTALGLCAWTLKGSNKNSRRRKPPDRQRKNATTLKGSNRLCRSFCSIPSGSLLLGSLDRGFHPRLFTLDPFGVPGRGKIFYADERESTHLRLQEYWRRQHPRTSLRVAPTQLLGLWVNANRKNALGNKNLVKGVSLWAIGELPS